MKYEIIIFDADETLFDFRQSEREALKNTMLEFDIAYDEDHHLKIYHGINNAIWKEFEQGLITQKNPIEVPGTSHLRAIDYSPVALFCICILPCLAIFNSKLYYFLSSLKTAIGTYL